MAKQTRPNEVAENQAIKIVTDVAEIGEYFTQRWGIGDGDDPRCPDWLKWLLGRLDQVSKDVAFTLTESIGRLDVNAAGKLAEAKPATDATRPDAVERHAGIGDELERLLRVANDLIAKSWALGRKQYLEEIGAAPHGPSPAEPAKPANPTPAKVTVSDDFRKAADIEANTPIGSAFVGSGRPDIDTTTENQQ